MPASGNRRVTAMIGRGDMACTSSRVRRLTLFYRSGTLTLRCSPASGKAIRRPSLAEISAAIPASSAAAPSRPLETIGSPSSRAARTSSKSRRVVLIECVTSIGSRDPTCGYPRISSRSECAYPGFAGSGREGNRDRYLRVFHRKRSHCDCAEKKPVFPLANRTQPSAGRSLHASSTGPQALTSMISPPKYRSMSNVCVPT